MKEIKAIIRPARLDDVSCSLRPHGHKEELLDYSPKVRIELVVEDQYASGLYDTIKQIGATNHVGDGIVWMTSVDSFDYIWQPE